MLTLAGGAEVVSLPSLGLFLFPPLLLERDLAVVDQIMMVHQVEAATSELAAASTWCTSLPLEELVHHSQVPLQEEGGEEEEAQGGEADDLCPASQGQQDSGQRRLGGWPLGKTPNWSSRPSVWTEAAAETWS